MVKVLPAAIDKLVFVCVRSFPVHPSRPSIIQGFNGGRHIVANRSEALALPTRQGHRVSLIVHSLGQCSKAQFRGPFSLPASEMRGCPFDIVPRCATPGRLVSGHCSQGTQRHGDGRPADNHRLRQRLCTCGHTGHRVQTITPHVDVFLGHSDMSGISLRPSQASENHWTCSGV